MPTSQSLVLPAIGQGVRIITGDSRAPMQVTAVVEWSSGDGALRARLSKSADPAALYSGQDATVEYFKGGAIHHLQTLITGISADGSAGGGGAFHRVELATPSRSRTVRRRRYPRLDVAMPVRGLRVELPADFRSESWRGRWIQSRWSRKLVDEGEPMQAAVIGAGGARLLPERSLSLDEHVYLEIDLEADAPVHVAGRVVWLSEPGDPPGVGVEFVGVSDGTRDAIGRYVSARTRGTTPVK